MGEKDSSFQRAFDSAWFTRVSRITMMAGVLIGLPVAGWFMTRLVDKADTVIETVDKQGKQLDLLEQFVRIQVDRGTEHLGTINSRLADHESRLRAVERRPAN